MYKQRKQYAEIASKVLNRTIKANEVKVSRDANNEEFVYHRNMSVDDIRKIISYLRYEHTNTVSNGVISTPVEINKVIVTNQTIKAYKCNNKLRFKK